MIVKLKVNKPMAGYAIGMYEVSADENGIPTDLHLRRRLKDAEIDDCCEVVAAAPVVKKKSADAASKGDK